MKIDISHTAKLANLSLTSEEKKKLTRQLEETLTYIEELNEVDTKNVTPTSNVTGLENVMAEDKAQDSFSQKEALANAKDTQHGFFKVKGIFEDE